MAQSNFLTYGKKHQSTIVWILCGAFVVLHFFTIVKYGRNFPYMDDMDATVRTAKSMYESSWADKVDLVFTRHNEHRIILNKGLDLLQLTLIGEVNIKHQLVIGNLFLLFIFLVTAFVYRKHVAKNWYFFLPAPLLIFSLKSYEAFIWPMVSIQTMGVISFALVSFVILFKDEKMSWRRMAAAFFSAAVATYACGNGFVTVLLCLTGLLIGKYPYKFAGAWFVLSIVLLTLYFHGHQQIPGHPDPWITILTDTHNLFGHFLVLLGNAYWLTGMFLLPVTLGAGFLTLSIVLYYFIPRQLYRINPVCFYFIIFLLLSCAVTSLNRSGFGVHQAFAVRYQIYSLLLALYIYFALLSLLRDEALLVAGIVVLATLGSSLGYFYARIFNLQPMEDMSYSMDYGSYAYYTLGKPAFSYPDQNDALHLIREVDSLGIYFYPKINASDLASQARSLKVPEPIGTIKAAFEIEPDNDYLMIPNGWAFIDGTDYNNMLTHVILRNKQRTLVYETHRKSRPDLSIEFSRNVDNSGFSLIVKKTDIPDGLYDFGFFIRKITPFATSKIAVQYEHRKLKKINNTFSWVETSRISSIPAVNLGGI
ncbi:hypothetical protein WBG78_17960 [Chryseolinea sp. T2]|uniref:hypothetical protein n=1 Tax=Chryseolinea sp. T2 TaxID=3129255 RepID=UPI003077C533